MLLIECNHGVPRNRVDVGTGQRSRTVLDSGQQTRFQVICVLKYTSWVTFGKSRISSNCSSQSSVCCAVCHCLCSMFSFSFICQNHKQFLNWCTNSTPLEVSCLFSVPYSQEQAPGDRDYLLCIIRNRWLLRLLCLCNANNHLFKVSIKPVLTLTWPEF